MLLDKYQSLDTQKKIRLIEVDARSIGADIYRFHAIPIYQEAKGDEPVDSTPILFGGERYEAFPYEITGIEAGSSSMPRPTLRIGDIESKVTALCYAYRDLRGATVNIIETLAEYLDGAEYESYEEKQVFTFMINSKRSAVAGGIIEFELNTPIDLGKAQIPSMPVTNICYWCSRGQYRSGDGCKYNGDLYFDKDGNPVDDPSKDVCGGTLTDCKIRFIDDELYFGGQPASTIRR